MGLNGDEALIKGLLDTGATINIISAIYYAQNQLLFLEGKSVLKSWVANKTLIKTVGILAEYL